MFLCWWSDKSEITVSNKSPNEMLVEGAGPMLALFDATQY